MGQVEVATGRDSAGVIWEEGMKVLDVLEMVKWDWNLKDIFYQLESVAIMTKFILYVMNKTIEDLGFGQIRKKV